MPRTRVAVFVRICALSLLLAAAFQARAQGLNVQVFFNSAVITSGEKAQLTVQVSRLGGATGIATTGSFQYPKGLTNSAAGVIVNGCGGTAAAPSGGTTFSLSGGATGFFCTITIELEAPTSPGTDTTYTVVFPAGGMTSNQGMNPAPSTATLRVTDVYVVTSAADTGANTLRDVITRANANCVGRRRIAFNLPGPGTIAVGGLALPPVSCAETFIDGFSQPGASPNTAAPGANNAVLGVALDGSACSACAGLELAGSAIIVKGLAIHSFAGGAGIDAPASASLYGNHLGTDLAGAAGKGNLYGVRVGSGGATIGGIPDAESNLIVGNGEGIRVTGRAFIQGNVIGAPGNGNGIGVHFADGFGTSEVGSNFIRFNSGSGVVVSVPFLSKTFPTVNVTANAIHANGGIGLDLGGDGPTANDEAPGSYDADFGPNGLQNFPVIASVTRVGADTRVVGSLKTQSGFYALEFFSNTTRTALTEGEKPIHQEFLGVDLANPDGNFDILIPGAHDNISATATSCPDGCFGTSEFSPTVALDAPLATLSPAALAFGPQVVGSTSAPQTVTLTNSGRLALAIALVEVKGDFAAASKCPPSLAAGSSCVIEVTFTATFVGTAGGTLNVTTNSAGSPHVVTLTGTGTAVPIPSLGVTPAALTFAARTLGTTSPDQVVTLMNTGTAPLAIASIAASGDFAFASSCPALLAPGASCTVAVRFTPIAAGARTGTLTVVSDAPGSPHTVALSGTGQPAGGPVIELLPPVLEFLPQLVGTTSAAQSVRVSNSGGAALGLLNVAVEGDFVLAEPPSPLPAGAMPTCATQVAPGEACDIHVAFTPRAVGLREGVLFVLSSASREASSVRLLGAGFGDTPPARALSLADVLRFGAQRVGTQSAGQALVIANLSNAAVSISGLTATGDFAVGDGCTSIPAGGSCTLLVFFTPTALGARTGALTLRVLSEAEPYTVLLEGTGEVNPVPLLTVSPTRLGFGSVLLGSAVEEAVQITNAGQVPVALAGAVAFGDFFLRNACGATLAPGERCTLVVSFFPRARGVRPGFVEIGSNAQGAPHRVEVSGTGCSPPNVARNRVQPLLCR